MNTSLSTTEFLKWSFFRKLISVGCINYCLRIILFIVKDKIVVDAASGSGYGTSILAESAAYAYGLELDKEAINFAYKHYKAENLKYLQGSINNLPFSDNSIEVVVSFETIEHVSEKLQFDFLTEIKRVLKKDGVLIISTPDKLIYSDKPGYNNEYHVKEFYRDEYSILSA